MEILADGPKVATEIDCSHGFVDIPRRIRMQCRACVVRQSAAHPKVAATADLPARAAAPAPRAEARDGALLDDGAHVLNDLRLRQERPQRLRHRKRVPGSLLPFADSQN